LRSTETKTRTTAKNHIQAKRQPFFTKEGQRSFFSESNQSPKAFFKAPAIQAKLTIGQPNDKYEVEADNMADTVVQSLSGSNEPIHQNIGYHGNAAVQTKCNDCAEEETLQKKENMDTRQHDGEIQLKPIFESNSEPPKADVQTKPINPPVIQAKCSTCEQEETLQKKEEEELSETETGIQTKSMDVPQEPSSDLQSRLSSSKGGGNSLSPDTQSSMGSAFGADFSNVRVHTGSESMQMNQELGAQAFTHGNDIYFNEGKYDTNSNSGNHLLAHELTHTIQQKNSINKSEIQCFRDHLSTIVNSLGSENEEGQRINLYTMGDGPIVRGTDQIFNIGFTPPQLPDNLSFYWMVLKNPTERLVYSRVTREPTVRISANESGSYLVYVSIRQNGQPMVTNTGGTAFLQINQVVTSSTSHTEENQEEEESPGLTSGSPPSCSGDLIMVDRSLTIPLGQIIRPTDSCSFSPLFHIIGRSVNITVTGSNTTQGHGDWSLTTIECPRSFAQGAACDLGPDPERNPNIVAGNVGQPLRNEYDPTIWGTRNLYFRIRNGSEGPMNNVMITLEPDIRDPLLQTIHDTLMVLGLLPGIGLVADGADALLYAAEGDWGDALISAAAMVPAFGDGATTYRIGSREVIRASRAEIERLHRTGSLRSGIRRYQREGREAGTRRQRATGRGAGLHPRRLPPSLSGCRLGSIVCPLDYLETHIDFIDHFRGRESFAEYTGSLPSEIALGRSLRSQDRLTRIPGGNQMYLQYLRHFTDPADWSPAFAEEMRRINNMRMHMRNAAGGFRELRMRGRSVRWPLDNSGRPWTVHHDPPLEFMSLSFGDSHELWKPMPMHIHDGLVSPWWNGIRRLILSPIPHAMRREILDPETIRHVEEIH